jgi:hypothetical protein
MPFDREMSRSMWFCCKVLPETSYREFRPFSGGTVEQRLNEGSLGDNVVPTDPFHLPFSHHRQSFISNQGAPCGPEPLEAEAGPDQPLYSPVILFHDVIEILDLPQFGEAPEPLVLLHVGHRLGIGGVLVDRNGARIDRVRPSQCFPEEALGGLGIALGAEPEIDGLAAAVGTGRPSAP